jgi:integral membrane sensor domain MASE1
MRPDVGSDGEAVMNSPWTFVFISGVFFIAVVRALVQPDEPWYRWGPPSGLLIIFIGAGLRFWPVALLGGAIFAPTLVADRVWRYRNGAGSVFR